MPSYKFSPKKAGKFRNQPVEIDGVKFASKREGNRYAELKILARIGEIVELECQPRYPLTINGVKVGTYVGDFRYKIVANGTTVVEDVKSKPTMTPIYRLKKKLMLAIHSINVKEMF